MGEDLSALLSFIAITFGGNLETQTFSSECSARSLVLLRFDLPIVKALFCRADPPLSCSWWRRCADVFGFRHRFEGGGPPLGSRCALALRG